jgi:hypothetical protein
MFGWAGFLRSDQFRFISFDELRETDFQKVNLIRRRKRAPVGGVKLVCDVLKQ